MLEDSNQVPQIDRATRVISALFLFDIDFLNEFSPGPHVSSEIGVTDVGSLMIDVTAG